MKAPISNLAYIPRGRSGRNVLVLVGYVVFLVIVMMTYARVFQYLSWRSTRDGRTTLFINGLYWTVTTMTTLGFGDITFVSHAGRLFSAFVTLTGFVFLLVFLPFGVISVIFAPWLENLLRYRPRLRLTRNLKGHVVICGWDTVTETLAKTLTTTGVSYVVLTPDMEEARRLEEARVNVVLGVPTHAEALKRVRTEYARVVIANMSDPDNTNLALTVASFCSTPVAAVVTVPERKELVRMAGATHVVPLRETLGNYMAVRATTRGAMGHVVDSLGNLLFAEIPAHGTPFVGVSLRDSGVRAKTGVSVIGIWQRGHFSLPRARNRDHRRHGLVVRRHQEESRGLGAAPGECETDDLVMILGYGTVGSAASAFLRHRKVPHIIVTAAEPRRDEPVIIQGDASRRAVLEKAGSIGPGAHRNH